MGSPVGLTDFSHQASSLRYASHQLQQGLVVASPASKQTCLQLVLCDVNFRFLLTIFLQSCAPVSFCYLPYFTLRLAIMVSRHMEVVINLISQPRGQSSYGCGHMKEVESDQSHTWTGLRGAKRMILHRKIK